MVRTIHLHRLFRGLVSTGILFLVAGSPGFALVDSDGDGIDDSIDNCPSYPNPAQDGGFQYKISGSLVTGGATSSFQISVDGQRAVYAADQDTDNVNELYSRTLPNGTLVKLNPPLPAGRTAA